MNSAGRATAGRMIGANPPCDLLRDLIKPLRGLLLRPLHPGLRCGETDEHLQQFYVRALLCAAAEVHDGGGLFEAVRKKVADRVASDSAHEIRNSIASFAVRVQDVVESAFASGSMYSLYK